ncbi:hypothetical protein [Ensifer adhaerens]|uniref:hypothetical protein n=1 Tax=Ensifer adhaerens TaxID=106592 RepID=UPI0011783FE8|nr:hypothetical protein [Ensifer adhaerens]
MIKLGEPLLVPKHSGLFHWPKRCPNRFGLMTGALGNDERRLVAILRASARLHFPDVDKADAEVERVLLLAIKEAEAGRCNSGSVPETSFLFLCCSSSFQAAGSGRSTPGRVAV